MQKVECWVFESDFMHLFLRGCLFDTCAARSERSGLTSSPGYIEYLNAVIRKIGWSQLEVPINPLLLSNTELKLLLATVGVYTADLKFQFVSSYCYIIFSFFANVTQKVGFLKFSGLWINSRWMSKGSGRNFTLRNSKQKWFISLIIFMFWEAVQWSSRSIV